MMRLSPRARAAWRRCLASPRVVTAVADPAIASLALLAPVIAPHDPQEQDLLATLLPPAWATGGDPRFPFGTDTLGRCILSRLLYGARIALYVAVVAATARRCSAPRSPSSPPISAAGSTADQPRVDSGWPFRPSCWR